MSLRRRITSSALLSFVAKWTLVASSPTPPPPPPSFKWSTVSSVIAFGDSYTYVQGTAGRRNFSFIGDLQNLNFTKEELFENRIVQNQTGTANGGPNWIEYLTGCGVKPGLTNPRDCKIPLWDFAFAGAGVGEEFLPLHHPYTTSLTQQINQFINSGHPALSPSLDKSTTLIASWIGINDISDSAANTSITDFPSFYSALQTKHFQLMDSLFQLGYQNFLFLNLPPLHKTPERLKKQNPNVNSTKVKWFNDALQASAFQFQRAHPRATVLVFDVYMVLDKMLETPTKWGFTNTTDWCAGVKEPDVFEKPEKYGCGNVDGYFWWDGGHVGRRVHEGLADEVKLFLNRGRRE